MIKIIFSDMDGTLLDENGNLPKGFDDVVAELKRRNVIFAPASGRQYFSLINSFKKYVDEFLFVAENGTIVMQNGKEVFSSPMNLDEVHAVREVSKTFGDILRVYCGKKDAYILKSQKIPEYLDELQKYYTQACFVDNFEEVNDIPLKLAFFDKTGNAAKNIYPSLKKFNGPMQVVLSSDYWVDVMNAGINKGVAVQNVQKVLGFSPDECAAFGDYLNDFEMMRAVTYSFAMANAHPDLKKAAKFETISNSEYGVLVGIKRLMEQGLI